MEIKKFTSDIIQNIIDNKIEKIIINLTKNYPIPILPDTIKIIIIGDRDIDFVNIPILDLPMFNCINRTSIFNHPLYYLPNNLTHLVFLENSDFNHPIDNLPLTLEFLELNGYFNYPLNNLPDNLKYLKIGGDFSHPLDNLPDNLKYLIIRGSFSHPLNNLPENLNYLLITLNSYNYNLDNLPSELKYLNIFLFDIFNGDFNNLPKKLEYLNITSYSYGFYKKKLDLLPNNLKYLGCNFDSGNNSNILDNLPNSLEELNIYYNLSLESLPNSIKILKIHNKYNKSLNLLPNSIEELELHSQKDINFGVLPKSITKLTLSNCDIHNINEIKIMYNLKFLHILFCKNKIEINYLPESLEYLEILWTPTTPYENCSVDSEILINNIPPNLKKIKTIKTNKYINDYLIKKPDLIIEY